VDDGAQPLHPRSGGEDIFVLKLASDGDYQWHTFYGSSASDISRGIDFDDNGDVYVAGASSQSWLGDNGVNPIHAYSSTGDIVIMKLDEDGGYLWHTFYGGSIGDLGQGVSAANDGFIYITGYSFSSWLGDDGQEPLHLFSDYYLHSDFVVLIGPEWRIPMAYFLRVE
jgi:hypothetical protein